MVEAQEEAARGPERDGRLRRSVLQRVFTKPFEPRYHEIGCSKSRKITKIWGFLFLSIAGCCRMIPLPALLGCCPGCAASVQRATMLVFLQGPHERQSNLGGVVMGISAWPRDRARHQNSESPSSFQLLALGKTSVIKLWLSFRARQRVPNANL